VEIEAERLPARSSHLVHVENSTLGYVKVTRLQLDLWEKVSRAPEKLTLFPSFLASTTFAQVCQSPIADYTHRPPLRGPLNHRDDEIFFLALPSRPLTLSETFFLSRLRFRSSDSRELQLSTEARRQKPGKRCLCSAPTRRRRKKKLCERREPRRGKQKN
jgi:hypothetical protein